MNNAELRAIVRYRGVQGRRSGGLRALVRGWRIDTTLFLSDPVARAAAISLMFELVPDMEVGLVVGIEKAGVALAAGIASLIGCDLTTVNPSLRSVIVSRGTAPQRTDLWAWNCKQAIVVDDTVNSGWTALRTIALLMSAGIQVNTLLCLVKYPRRAPPFLQLWPGSVRAVYGLEDLGLRRIGLKPLIDLR